MSVNRSASGSPRIALAGDRDIAVAVLEVIHASDMELTALLLPSDDSASHAAELRRRCTYLTDDKIFTGHTFRSDAGLARLRRCRPDYLLCIHFPHYIPLSVLSVPTECALNLHPAYLPYGRGWHTPSWAILDDVPFGATLHVMTEEIDAGPVVHQKRLPIRPDDTANSLYHRVKRLERTVFEEAWPLIQNRTLSPTPQPNGGTQHRKDDLLQPAVQRIDCNQSVRAGDLIDRLRALTTNRIEEAAYFEQDGQRYRLQLRIVPELPDSEAAPSSPQDT
jgi:methionyl-tRNA formyltransferase